MSEPRPLGLVASVVPELRRTQLVKTAALLPILQTNGATTTKAMLFYARSSSIAALFAKLYANQEFCTRKMIM